MYGFLSNIQIYLSTYNSNEEVAKKPETKTKKCFFSSTSLFENILGLGLCKKSFMSFHQNHVF